jgi:hypothetical protein
MPNEIQAGARSLEEIENDVWGNAPEGSTRLVSTVHALRRKPVHTLTAEDLRLMILQQEGLPVLVPLALRHLERDPYEEGDLYPGSLLEATLRVPVAYWAAHPDHASRVDAVATRALAPSDDLDKQADQELRDLIHAFRARR